MVKGSCLCGAVRFEFDARSILLVDNCHCTMCRKVSGAAFGTFLTIPATDFRWIAGEEVVATYESSPGYRRAFCRICGSRAPETQLPNPSHVSIPAGSLDDDPGIGPQINIFTANKAPWYTISDSLPSIPGQETDEFWSRFIKERRRGA